MSVMIADTVVITLTKWDESRCARGRPLDRIKIALVFQNKGLARCRTFLHDNALFPAMTLLRLGSRVRVSALSSGILSGRD
jgi:hypothetical protein